jgi:hypothetical protein
LLQFLRVCRMRAAPVQVRKTEVGFWILQTPWTVVLSMFTQAYHRVDQAGGLVNAHHLDFDAGLTAEELQRADMGPPLKQMNRMARNVWCIYTAAKIMRPMEQCSGLEHSFKHYGRRWKNADTTRRCLLGTTRPMATPASATASSSCSMTSGKREHLHHVYRKSCREA